MMTYLAIWTASYLIAGMYFVSKDMREPPHNRPAYIRTARGRWKVRLLWPYASAMVFWFLFSFGNNQVAWKHTIKHLRGQLIPATALFIGIGIVGTTLISK